MCMKNESSLPMFISCNAGSLSIALQHCGFSLESGRSAVYTAAGTIPLERKEIDAAS